MSGILLVSGVIVLSLATSFSQVSSFGSTSDFDHQLIEWQKHFLRLANDHDTKAINRAIADDFRGIGTNGDFYDKGEAVSSDEENNKNARSYDFQVIKLNDASAVVSYNLIVPGEHPRYRHMADTWARVNGSWKLKFRQITPNLWSANDTD